MDSLAFINQIFLLIQILLTLIIILLGFYAAVKISKRISVNTAENAKRKFIDKTRYLCHTYDSEITRKNELAKKKIDALITRLEDKDIKNKIELNDLVELQKIVVQTKILLDKVNAKLSDSRTLKTDLVDLVSEKDLKKCIEDRNDCIKKYHEIFELMDNVDSLLSDVDNRLLKKKGDLN